MALAGKRVFTLLGDGELTEGSNWEAFLAGSHYALDNLTVILDYNGLQITGPSQAICRTEPLKEKFEAFGWSVRSANGHSAAELSRLFQKLPFEQGKPNMMIANTVKGKGISFIENNHRWHHKVPTEKEYELALAELNRQRQALLELA